MKGFISFSDSFASAWNFDGSSFSSPVSEFWDLLKRQSQETASSSSEVPGPLPEEALCQAKESGSEHIDQAPQPSDPPRTDTSKASDACDVIAKEKSTEAVAEGEALVAASPLPLGAILVFLRVLFLSASAWF